MGAVLTKGPNLGRVVMPLVRLLQSDELCWDDCAAVADAIRATLHKHAGMVREQQHLAGVLAGAACNAGKQVGRVA